MRYFYCVAVLFNYNQAAVRNTAELETSLKELNKLEKKFNGDPNGQLIRNIKTNLENVRNTIEENTYAVLQKIKSNTKEKV